jgi:hypothetical protein
MAEAGGKPPGPLEPEAIRLVSDILSCSDLLIEDILDDAGVVGVPFADEFVPFRVHVRDGGSSTLGPSKGIRVHLPGLTDRKIIKPRPRLEPLDPETVTMMEELDGFGFGKRKSEKM